MLYRACCVPVSPMRSEASHKSEMVSQLLFGECCLVIEQGKEEWVKIKCRYDGYEGWCQASHITEIEEEKYDAATNKITGGWINHVEYNNQLMMVPFGSWLTALDNGHAYWKEYRVSFARKIWNIDQANKSEELIRQIAFQFLNTGYLWGGKSVFGVDCSGFTQTVFRFFGIPLLRDTWQQATQGKLVETLEEVRCGDLAFFDNTEGKITHVGILLNSSEIIHASGKVRIDKIDELGIINSDNYIRTHQLKIIKRYF
jgi:gamma-D-glutamyl-L-lysine dipeptidyl-peptidase